MSKQTIGEFLATLRKANGLTQMEVAEKLGISNRTLSAWECNTALPDILLLPALADLYNVTVDEILSGERKTSQAGQIADKSQQKILQGKLAKLTMPSILLTGLTILGVVLFFVGLYVDLVTFAWTGWQWWLLLLFGGAIMAMVCAVILIAVFASETASADDELQGYPAFCLLAGKKLSLCLLVIAIPFIVAFLCSFALSTDAARYTIIIISLIGGVAFALAGYFSFNSRITKYATDQTKIQYEKCSKKHKKLALWGLILAGITITFIIVAICLADTPASQVKRTVYSANNRGEFVTELECYTFDKSVYQGESFYNQLPESGDYYFDITVNANREKVSFGNGFYGQYLKENRICMLYCMVDMDNDGKEEQLFLANFYRYYSEDGTWSVFVAKYCVYPASIRPEGGPDFTIKEQSGKISLVVSTPNTTDIVVGWVPAVSTLLSAIYYAVIFILALKCQHRLKIKL